jgi:hypothetical protein
MSSTPLQTLFDKVKSLCVAATKDGKLEVQEVLNIAFVALKGIVAFTGLSVTEKKALVLLSLQHGLSAAGSLKGFDRIDPSISQELEKQVLSLATQSAFAALDAVPQVFEVGAAVSCVRQSLSKYLPFCSQAAEVLSTLDPKDSALIAEAVELLTGVQSALEVRTVESTQVSQTAVAAPVAAPAVPVAAAVAPVAPVAAVTAAVAPAPAPVAAVAPVAVAPVPALD